MLALLLFCCFLQRTYKKVHISGEQFSELQTHSKLKGAPHHHCALYFNPSLCFVGAHAVRKRPERDGVV
jgi:hypothetical protein